MSMKRSNTGPLTIAITGIDGAGKSTLTRRIIEIFPEKDALVLRCPRFHETPNAPLSDLSKDLDALSQVADTLESFHLKAIAQFIQISLFGPVESFLINTFKPALLINERHPIIDAFAYGYFYISKMNGKISQKQLEAPLINHLDKIRPGAVQSIEKWLNLTNRSQEKNLTLWNYQDYLAKTFSLKEKTLVKAIAAHTRAALPDILFLIDIKGDDAKSRVSGREDTPVEMHEQSDMLSQIRTLYVEAIDFFVRTYPEMETRIITSDTSKSIDQTIDEIMRNISI